MQKLISIFLVNLIIFCTVDSIGQIAYTWDIFNQKPNVELITSNAPCDQLIDYSPPQNDYFFVSKPQACGNSYSFYYFFMPSTADEGAVLFNSCGLDGQPSTLDLALECFEYLGNDCPCYSDDLYEDSYAFTEGGNSYILGPNYQNRRFLIKVTAPCSVEKVRIYSKGSVNHDVDCFGVRPTSYSDVSSLGPDQFELNVGETSCESSISICGSQSTNIGYQNYNTTSSGTAIFYLDFQTTNVPSSISIIGSNIGSSPSVFSSTISYSIIGPLSQCESACEIGAGITEYTLYTGQPISSFELNSSYILKIICQLGQSTSGINLEVQYSNLDCDYTYNPPSLETGCIPLFSPPPGKYVLTAWTKEEGALSGSTNYTNPEIRIFFSEDPEPSLVAHTSGRIIDGWQMIDFNLEIPVDAEFIKIELATTGSPVLYDDIRFFPTDGSMKSYVYDPVNLRLVAELDERHFSTFYEYNEEGQLTRIKKETERGIMTIQESKTGIVKK